MPTVVSFRTLLAMMGEEIRKKRANKRQISHALAKGFMDRLVESEGVTLLEAGTGNANYFCVEIDGKPLAVSPFGSHDEWWEKQSEGFRALVERRRCRWGVVLFVLRKSKGLWIEGSDYDAKVLKGRETVNSSEVSWAEKSGIAHPFRDASEFLRLIKDGPKTTTPRHKVVLIRRDKPDPRESK